MLLKREIFNAKVLHSCANAMDDMKIVLRQDIQGASVHVQVGRWVCITVTNRNPSQLSSIYLRVLGMDCVHYEPNR